jgi:hypothetical protein
MFIITPKKIIFFLLVYKFIFWICLWNSDETHFGHIWPNYYTNRIIVNSMVRLPHLTSIYHYVKTTEKFDKGQTHWIRYAKSSSAKIVTYLSSNITSNAKKGTVIIALFNWSGVLADLALKRLHYQKSYKCGSNKTMTRLNICYGWPGAKLVAFRIFYYFTTTNDKKYYKNISHTNIDPIADNVSHNKLQHIWNIPDGSDGHCSTGTHNLLRNLNLR